jgi:hypothetical protein
MYPQSVNCFFCRRMLHSEHALVRFLSIEFLNLILKLAQGVCTLKIAVSNNLFLDPYISQHRSHGALFRVLSVMADLVPF